MEGTNWTIDEALCSLYDDDDENNKRRHDSTASEDPMNWWNIDDGTYYHPTNPKERTWKHSAYRLDRPPEHSLDDDHPNRGTDDDNEITISLLQELHTDPLALVLETIAQNGDIDTPDRTENENNNSDDDDDDFGDFQSAKVDAITNDSNVSTTPLAEPPEEGKAASETDATHDDPEISTTNPPAETSTLHLPLTISFDDEDNEELIQYVDSILSLGGPTDNTTTTAMNRPCLTTTTPASSTTLCTPDLVRIVDDIIDAATTGTHRRDENIDHMNDPNVDDPMDQSNGASPPPPQQCYETETDNPVVSPPLSMKLPVGDDLSSLESRFIRRMQQLYYSENESGSAPPLAKTLFHETVDNSVNTASIAKSKYPDLPAYYFTSPDLDDTVSVLQSMPWEYVLPSHTRGVGSFHQIDVRHPEVADSGGGEAWAMWDEYVTSRLCQLDTAREDIQADTVRHIQPHQERIARANILIHEWDQNLRLSLMYCERSQEAIRALIGDNDDDMIGLSGPSVLLQLFEQRDDYRQLSLILDQLNDIWAGERDIMTRIDRFNVENCKALDEYFAVMKLAKELDCRVSDSSLTQLHCLVSLRDRLKSIGMRFWARLLDIAKSIVVKTCRDTSSFDRNQYERVLRAILDLKSQSIVDESVANVDLSTSWTENILSTEAYEIDRAFASALLKPTECEVSSHETELRQLTYELELHWGDYAKLRGVLLNLVTVRFDFEWQLSYLPRVFHRLCKCLTDILIAHNIFVKWHRDSVGSRSSNDSTIVHSDLKSIYDSMIAHTRKIWEHCESIVANCLDEYLNCAPKRPLFKRGTNGVDDVLWRDDLERLHNVYSLANTFLSIKKSFFELNECSQPKVDFQCLFSSKIVSIFRRHVRTLHVEAMNTLGRCLANESWILGSFVVSAEPERTDQPELSIEAILLRAMHAALRQSEQMSTDVKNTICDLSWSYDSRSLAARLDANENPFDSVTTSNFNRNAPNESMSSENDVELSEHMVYRTLSTFIHENDGAIRLAPEAVSKELIAWFARLLMVLEKLPLISEDISNVFINLCDLYFTTVFRLCSGSAKHERLILGEDSPIHMYCNLDDSKSGDKASGTQLFGSFRNTPKKTSSGKNLSRRLTFPANLDAQICFPRPRHQTEVSVLSKFIDRAQKTLKDAVNLDMIDSWLVDPNADSPEEQGCEVARVLIKREGSISSCYTVAALIEVSQKVARQNQSSLLPQEFLIDRELSSLRMYSQSVLDVVPTFVRVARQIACTRAVAGGTVVKDIIRVDAGWEECKLHEYCNDYVDELSYRCALIWGYVAASNKLPLIITRETWEGIVSASYLSLLDGFSRIRQCSTEGRSLMALDLATFKVGLSPTNIAEKLDGIVLVNKPPPINPEVNFFFVETYVKVFYYPSDDVFNWIKDNCDKYGLNHCIGLALAVFLSNQEEKSEDEFNVLLTRIKSLYPVDEKQESISIRQE